MIIYPTLIQKIYIIKDRRLALEKKKDQSLKHCKENNLLMDKTCEITG